MFVILKASFFIIMYGYHAICFTEMLNKFKEAIAVTEMHTSHSGAEGGGGGGGPICGTLRKCLYKPSL